MTLIVPPTPFHTMEYKVEYRNLQMLGESVDIKILNPDHIPPTVSVVQFWLYLLEYF